MALALSHLLRGGAADIHGSQLDNDNIFGLLTEAGQLWPDPAEHPFLNHRHQNTVS